MTTEIKGKTPVSAEIQQNESFLKERAGVGKSFDLGVRKIKVVDREIQLYYLNSLCDTAYIIQILKELINIKEEDVKSNPDLVDVVSNHLVHQQLQKKFNLDEVVDQLLSGLIIILIEGEAVALIVDVRNYPGRTPQEPDTEKVVRGARDGFTENIIENSGLLRRRIRDERLRNEIFKVGERSKTDLSIAYLQDVADPNLIKLIKKEIEQIEIDGIPMSDKTIEEYLVHQGFNPFPLVRYTERPDVAASHLLEGHVLIITDTSPSVIITPTTYFHHVQHAEEYRQTPMIGAFLRWVRFLGMFMSIFLLPLWFMYASEPHLLPPDLAYIGPNETGNVPLIGQLLLADFGIDLLRMAAIHTPTPLSTAMGLIAAVLIGQIAIDVGLFQPEVILYVAVGAIGSFATPSYELSVANKVIRTVLLLSVFFFKLPGFIIGITVLLILIARIRTLETPYLWPFLPFNPQAFFQILVRVSVPLTKLRPSIVHPRNPKKQPS